ncbi:Periplasmic nitrate reductase, partial [Frankliniella fusca]
MASVYSRSFLSSPSSVMVSTMLTSMWSDSKFIATSSSVENESRRVNCPRVLSFLLSTGSKRLTRLLIPFKEGFTDTSHRLFLLSILPEFSNDSLIILTK